MAAKHPARMPSLPEQDWTPGAREIFAMVVPPDTPLKGWDFNSILLLAHHPELAKGWLTFNEDLSKGWALPNRLLEIGILRVAWNRQMEYEWVHHMLLGERLGFDTALYRAVQVGPDDPSWSDVERHVLVTAEQACHRQDIDDATWAGLAKHLDSKQMLELMFGIGSYVMLAWIFNSSGLEVEPPYREQARALGYPMLSNGEA